MAMTRSSFVVVAALLLLFIVDGSHSKDLAKIDLEGVDPIFHSQLAQYGPGSLRSYQCPGQCQRRCAQTQYKKPCLFFCQKCCTACLCVPPGFYGNKGVCPCYNNWKTKRGGPKCP